MRTLEDVNQVTLAQRLKNMELVGIVNREEETIDKQSVTYNLTEMGMGLLPILQDIKEFAEKFKSKREVYTFLTIDAGAYLPEH